MKHLKILAISLSLLLASVGCSDELHDQSGGSVTGKIREVEITFNLGVNAGLQTRTQRPLESSDNWQRVSNMRIYVFRSETEGNDADYTYYKPDVYDVQTGQTIKKDYFNVEQFGGKGDVIWGQNGEEDEEHSYSIKPLLPEGHYKFLAIGRDDITETDNSKIVISDPNLDFPEEYPEEFVDHINQQERENVKALELSPKWEEGKTSLDKALLRSSQYRASEVFSGCSENIYVNEKSKGFQKRIELKRTVAGILLYVKNVPKKAVAMATIKQVDEWNDEIEVVIKDNEYPVDQIGIASVAYSRDVTLSERQPTGNSVLNASWSIPFYTSYVGGKPNNEGRLLSGNFVIPQPIHDKVLDIGDEKLANALYLVYYTNSHEGGGNQLTAFHWRAIRCVSDNGEAHIGDAYKFPIQANHFYSLGEKNKDTDKPIDLGEEDGVELTITVHADWENVGDYGLED